MPKITSQQLSILHIKDQTFEDLGSASGIAIESVITQNACLEITKITGSTRHRSIVPNLFDGVLETGNLFLDTSITNTEYYYNKNYISVTGNTSYCFFRKNSFDQIHFQWLDSSKNVLFEESHDGNHFTITSPSNAAYFRFYELKKDINYYCLIWSSEIELPYPSPVNYHAFDSVVTFDIQTKNSSGYINNTIGHKTYIIPSKMCSLGTVSDNISQYNNMFTLNKAIDELIIDNKLLVKNDVLSSIYNTVLQYSYESTDGCFFNDTLCNIFTIYSYDDFLNALEGVSYSNGTIYIKIPNAFLDQECSLDSVSKFFNDNPLRFLYVKNEIDHSYTYTNGAPFLCTYDGFTRVESVVSNGVKPILDVTFKSAEWYNRFKYSIEYTVDYNSEFSVVKDKIESKVWQTDITTAIDILKETEISLIRNQYSSIEQDIGSIESTVADITLKTNEMNSQLTVMETKITQTENNITSQAITINGLGTKISTVEQTADELSVKLEQVSKEASKTAVNYLKFDESGLVVGDMIADTLGNNILIGIDGIKIRNGETVYASYSADAIYIGMNNRESIIDLCNGVATMENIGGEDYNRLMISSDDEVSIQGEKSILLVNLSKKIQMDGATQGVETSSISLYNARPWESPEESTYAEQGKVIIVTHAYEDFGYGIEHSCESHFKLNGDSAFISIISKDATKGVSVDLYSDSPEGIPEIRINALYGEITLSANAINVDSEFRGMCLTNNYALKSYTTESDELELVRINGTSSLFGNGSYSQGIGIAYYSGNSVRIRSKTDVNIYPETGIANIIESNLRVYRTDKKETKIEFSNTNHAGKLSSTADGNLGLYDTTHKKWLIYSNASGTVNSNTSDRREKKDIDYMTDETALNIIKNLKPCSFKYIDDKVGLQRTGFIVQDILDSLKEQKEELYGGVRIFKNPGLDELPCVDMYEDEENVRYAIDYEDYIAPMTKTIQYLLDKVDKLEQQLELNKKG